MSSTTLALEQYALSLGDVVTVHTIGSAAGYGAGTTGQPVGMNKPLVVRGTVVDATISVLVLDVDGARWRIRWPAIAAISTATPVPDHPSNQ